VCRDYDLPVGRNDEIEDDSVRYLLYCNFANPKGKRSYKRVVSTDALGGTMNTFLDDYNAVSSKPMKLVLFLFAMEHVCRISRVLQVVIYLAISLPIYNMYIYVCIYIYIYIYVYVYI